MPKKATFTERLSKIRNARGLTQTELSKLTGISQRVIAHYETKTKKPDPKYIMILAKTLNVSIDELMGFKPTKEKELVKNKTLLKKIKMLDKLHPEDQKTVINLIDNLYKRN
jgi:transcriptional regulator with XRE-family HTH domain